MSAGGKDSPEAMEALESLCRSYWPAIHAYIRRTGQPTESARDLTQEFFAQLLTKGWLRSADQQKGRFRTFLLVVLKRFLADEHDRATALKRGGGASLLSLEELAAEEDRPFEPASHRTPEQDFDRRWALATLDNTLKRLRKEASDAGLEHLFLSLQGFLGGADSDESLQEISRRFELGEGAVRMRLSRWRSRYRELLRQEIAQTVPRVADLDEEMNHLLQALIH